GGGEGTRGAVILNRGTEGEVELPSKFPYRKSAAGERLCLIGPCGGGYGDPAERDPDAGREDVLDGFGGDVPARANQPSTTAGTPRRSASVASRSRVIVSASIATR